MELIIMRRLNVYSDTTSRHYKPLPRLIQTHVYWSIKYDINGQWKNWYSNMLGFLFDCPRRSLLNPVNYDTYRGIMETIT